MTGLPTRLTPQSAPWLFAMPAQAVFAMLAGGGFEGRAVGGAVRNALIGEPVSDVDIATSAPPKEVIRLAEAAGLKAVPTGIAHGTVTVIAQHHPFEVTTLRRDLETFGRHATVAFTDDWAEDACRRDFTMNALYCGADGTLHDPVGGLTDLEQRRVRFIGDASQRIAEDYLRILRFFRFMAQYGAGAPDADGLAACVRGRRGLDVLSGERVRQEMVKLIVARGAASALATMYDLGLVTEVLASAPSPTVLARLIAIEAGCRIAPSAMRRLAVLLVTTPEHAEAVAGRLKVSNAERDALGLAARPFPRQASDDEIREAVYRFGAEATLDLVLITWARQLTVPIDDNHQRRALELVQTWPVPRFPLTGADVVQLGIAPGQDVGRLLRDMERRWIASGFHESRDDLLAALATAVSSAR
jgi:tRNA nucleotidyltransferase/poly(A) polymerase